MKAPQNVAKASTLASAIMLPEIRASRMVKGTAAGTATAMASRRSAINTPDHSPARFENNRLAASTGMTPAIMAFLSGENPGAMRSAMSTRNHSIRKNTRADKIVSPTVAWARMPLISVILSDGSCCRRMNTGVNTGAMAPEAAKPSVVGIASASR